jgi:hypothetical protein
MKQRLLAAKQRHEGLSLAAVGLKTLEFDSPAFEDLAWWIKKGRAQVLRIVRLVREIQRDLYSGLGKPTRDRFQAQPRLLPAAVS